MTPSTIGSTINKEIYPHYYAETQKPSRETAPLDFLGNSAYFAGRGVARVCVLAKRFFCSLVFGALTLYNLAKKNPTLASHHSFKQEAKLAGISALRLLTPIAQIALAVVGAIGKGVTTGDLQKNGARLLCLAHNIDAKFDQWDWDIEHEPVPQPAHTPGISLGMTAPPFPAHPDNGAAPVA